MVPIVRLPSNSPADKASQPKGLVAGEGYHVTLEEEEYRRCGGRDDQ